MSLRAPFLLALLCLLLSHITAQELTTHSCGVTTSISQESKKDGYSKRLSKYKARVADIVSKQLKNNEDPTVPCPNGITIIPIAFHLFHESGAAIGERDNFSLSDLNLVVDYLNMHFSGINPEKEILGDAFSNFDAGNTCIQFTIGKINRIDRQSCVHWVENATQYQLHQCLPGGSGVGSANDPNDFLNIYVTELRGGLLGQASNIPGILGSSNAKSDGITLSHKIIIPGNSNYTLFNKGGILSHEIGHWLGLPHVDGDIQGSGCAGDDGIEDTYPQEKKNTYLCSEPIPRSCNTPDNVYNFMDYSVDCAKLMFTRQQSLIMNDVMLNDRKSLSGAYARMDKSSPLYNLDIQEEVTTRIEWINVDCQERINLLQFQKKWTERAASQQGFAGTKNYYWEKRVSATSQKAYHVIDERYLCDYNVLSNLGKNNNNSVVILKLKEQQWDPIKKSYALPETKGIILVIVSDCPSPVNDMVENAITLNQGTLCSDESYSLLYSNNETDINTNKAISKDNDVWFKIKTTSQKEMIALMVKRPNSGADNPILEAYNLDMKPLEIVQEDKISESYYYVEKTEGISDFYIRAFDAEKSVADPFQICRLANDDINDNCDDAYPLEVLSSCKWLGFSFEGSTPSKIEEANYNCGVDKEFYDVWFESTVPESGYFSVKCKNRGGAKNDMLLEVYSGTCENKQLIGCQMVYGIGGNDPIAYLPIVGRTSGEQIFIRVGGAGFGEQGDFEICVSKSFENICTITKIEIGDNIDCNYTANTYSQKLTVSYQSTSAMNKLILNGQYFTLIENPQTVILRDLPADKPLTLKANLLNLEDPTCWNKSAYTVESIHQDNLPCQREDKKNEICFDSRILDIDCSEKSYSFDKSHVSAYRADNGCITNQKDEWFELIVPESGSLSIELLTSIRSSNLVMEVYEGSCTEMQLVTCIKQVEDDVMRIELEDLPVGEIVYARIADISNEFQGLFSLCVKDPEVASFRSYDNLLSTQESHETNITTEEDISISCYPNPTTEYINFKIANYDQSSSNNITVLDRIGRILSVVPINAISQTLDLSTFDSGIYFLEFLINNKRISKRIVKS